ncbi:MAG: MBOAT family protein [Parasporobacterium sp.]|nr:MBOAT family protein [Parasporobacterium sp.]
MVFADLYFLLFFLPLCVICYFIARKIQTRNIILIIFSLIFYAWGEPLWVFLLIFSAAFNWYMGRLIGSRKESPNGKVLVAISLVVDIGLLFVFKYTGFFIATINGIFGASIPIPDITLPIGISFFTFQAISYIVDCYWGTVEPQMKFHRFLLYLSLFPQLIAGPIVRYSVVAEEISERRTTAVDMYEGIIRLVVGLTKKVIIANNLWTIVDTFFGQNIVGLSTMGTWYTLIVYSLYVYFDFSGYSDMAIGMGRIFGFHFDENFNHPFLCQTIAEFWQRWHISLGSFFRDYLLYVPLFGKRRKYFGLFLVWFCTGMWHGASWNFILWGLYYGLFILFEQKLGKKKLKKWPLWWKHIYTKLVILIGFGIFYFEDFGQLGQFFLNITGINAIAGNSPFADPITWSSFIGNIFLIAAAVILCWPVRTKIMDRINKIRNIKNFGTARICVIAVCMVLFTICAIFLVDSTNNPFLYWRF